MNYAFLILTIIVSIQELHAKLPDYVHVHTFEEIIETNYVLLDKLNLCDDSKNMNNRILIAIKTAANNYIQRQIVRQTWLIEVKEHHIPYVFVLGSTNDEKLIDEILDEDNIYNDLLIGKPVDNYYNLTLKAMFIFAWTKVHCPNRWLFYVDDDTIINAQQVIDFISLRKNVLNRVLYCHMGQHFARRNPQSKWFVPLSIWEPALYPKYCQGWGCLIPPNVLSLLHDTSISNLTEPKLWIDDVFMTGIVAEVAGIELIESPMACCGRRDSELYEKSLLLAQMGKKQEFLKSWNIVKGTSLSLTNILPNNRILINKMSRFDKEEYLLPTKIQMNKKLLTHMTGNYYLKLMNSNYTLLINTIVLIVVIILLYVRFLREILLKGFENFVNR
ncbi:unnamed protein product [Adineta steineri]|uniref:Hexosyltransferase n=1 Tax=Adineta steineri TaxID=433720 RepID=A0A814FS72_9BILA|nr:unnamed protein product [Adineta steineri]